MFYMCVCIPKSGDLYTWDAIRHVLFVFDTPSRSTWYTRGDDSSVSVGHSSQRLVAVDGTMECTTAMVSGEMTKIVSGIHIEAGPPAARTLGTGTE